MAVAGLAGVMATTNLEHSPRRRVADAALFLY